MKQGKREAPNSLVETDPLIIAIHNQADHIVTLEKERDAIKFDPLSLKRKKLNKKLLKRKNIWQNCRRKKLREEKQAQEAKMLEKSYLLYLRCCSFYYGEQHPKKET